MKQFLRWVRPTTKQEYIDKDNTKDIEIKVFDENKEWKDVNNDTYIYWSGDPKDWYYYANNDINTGRIEGLKVKRIDDNYIYDVDYGANQIEYMIPNGVTSINTFVFHNLFYQRGDYWIEDPNSDFIDYSKGIKLILSDNLQFFPYFDISSTNFISNVKKINFTDNQNVDFSNPLFYGFSYNTGINNILKEITIPKNFSQLNYYTPSFPLMFLTVSPISLILDYSMYEEEPYNWSSYTVGHPIIPKEFENNIDYGFSNLNTLKIIRENNNKLFLSPICFHGTRFIFSLSGQTPTSDFTQWKINNNINTLTHKDFFKSLKILCNFSKEEKNNYLDFYGVTNPITFDITIKSIIQDAKTVRGTLLDQRTGNIIKQDIFEEIPSDWITFFDAFDIVPIKSSYQLFSYLESIGNVFYNQDIIND